MRKSHSIQSLKDNTCYRRIKGGAKKKASKDNRRHAKIELRNSEGN